MPHSEIDATGVVEIMGAQQRFDHRMPESLLVAGHDDVHVGPHEKVEIQLIVGRKWANPFHDGMRLIFDIHAKRVIGIVG